MAQKGSLVVTDEAADDLAATYFWYDPPSDLPASLSGWFYGNVGHVYGPFATYDEAVTHWSAP